MLCLTKGVKGVLDAGWQKWDPSKKIVLTSQLPRGPAWLKQKNSHPHENKGERIIPSLPLPKDTTPRIAPWWHSSLKSLKALSFLDGNSRRKQFWHRPESLDRVASRVTTDVEPLFLVFSYWSRYVLCAFTCCSVSVCQVAVSAPISQCQLVF